MAVAKDDVSVDHWFRLGRSLTAAAGTRTLLSWSGSMFEYLMPALVMQTFPFTLLDQTNKGCVKRQIAHLPISWLRRSRSRAQTRLEQGAGDCTVRHAPGDDRRAETGSQESDDARGGGRARTVRLPGCARLHAA